MIDEQLADDICRRIVDILNERRLTPAPISLLAGQLVPPNLAKLRDAADVVLSEIGLL